MKVYVYAKLKSNSTMIASIGNIWLDYNGSACYAQTAQEFVFGSLVSFLMRISAIVLLSLQLLGSGSNDLQQDAYVWPKRKIPTARPTAQYGYLIKI